jgi:hypothetical protein
MPIPPNPGPHHDFFLQYLPTEPGVGPQNWFILTNNSCAEPGVGPCCGWTERYQGQNYTSSGQPSSVFSSGIHLPVFRIRIHLIRIRIQHFRLNTDPEPWFWWTTIVKNLQLKKNIFWSTTICLTLGLHKGRPVVEATEEAFSTQKRTSSTWKHEIS